MSLQKAHDEYQTFTNTTAVYPREFVPGTAAGNIYLALGLADEAGELCEKISVFTSQVSYIHEKPLRKITKQDILDEMGDVMWYAARLADDNGRKLSQMIHNAPPYAGIATLDGIAMFICAKAGYVAGRTKKRLRDIDKMDEGELQENFAAQFIAIGEIFSALGVMGRFFGSQLHEIMEMNRIKLSSRKQRGVIQGDGDKR